MQRRIDNIIELHLNSKDRSLSLSDNHKRFILNPPIRYNRQREFVMIGLKSALIPRSFYTTNDSNNKFKIIVNSIEYIITLSPANYTILTIFTDCFCFCFCFNIASSFFFIFSIFRSSLLILISIDAIIYYLTIFFFQNSY